MLNEEVTEAENTRSEVALDRWAATLGASNGHNVEE
jgi:hypothetical protein